MYFIWLDSKLHFNADSMLIIKYFLWRKKAEYAISAHYDHTCVWEEVLQNKCLNKYNHTAIDRKFYFYQSEGLWSLMPLAKILFYRVVSSIYLCLINSPMSKWIDQVYNNCADVPEGSFMPLVQWGQPFHLTLYIEFYIHLLEAHENECWKIFSPKYV